MNAGAKNPGPLPRDGSKQPPAPQRTGEGSGTALEAMIRKRKQVESPEPPDGAGEQPATP
ncbi:MAG: hypothetical protein K0R89_344 [Ramlibacter sp.]|jgi:hypothetical protein|nr:hypothetical protein [Ramlibacter sp.]